MSFKKKLPGALLYLFAAGALLLGLISVGSLFGLMKLSAISDNSSAPIAAAGSVEIAIQSPSKGITTGDLVLVSSHLDGRMELGKVVQISENSNGHKELLLKAPASNTPDQWGYTTGSTTYRHLFSAPLLGFPILLFNSTGFSLVFAIGSIVLLGFLLMLFRKSFFSVEVKPAENRIQEPEPKEAVDNLAILQEMFDEAYSEQLRKDEESSGIKRGSRKRRKAGSK